eukprot:TRINITY_DN65580_c0_g1_i1.p1 TRINITY_DN65580_c0_g1~~TRINITY_DN65580_c0_g1_i1.p1  ORF type:complete len:764 (+),score=128.62 TRINITY_DN65580_c0_g1_i1:26-2293(+)
MAMQPFPPRTASEMQPFATGYPGQSVMSSGAAPLYPGMGAVRGMADPYSSQQSMFARSTSHALAPSPSHGLAPSPSHGLAPSLSHGLAPSPSHALAQSASMAMAPPPFQMPGGGFQFRVESKQEVSDAGVFSQSADPPAPPPPPAPAVGLQPAASMQLGPVQLSAVRGRNGVAQRHRGASLGVSQEPIGCTMQLDECIARCRREVQAIAAECRSRGQKFTDVDFPADNRSLFMNGQSPSTASFDAEIASQTTWCRASEGALRSQAAAASQPGEEGLIVGALAGAYLQGAMASMRTVNRDPRELIVWWEPEAGVYGVRFFKDGEWMYEVLDDFLPITPPGHPPACSTNQASEDWPALIEKAYAKVHGCYEAVAAGCEEDAMEDVLGSGVVRLDVKDFSIWAELWQNLRGKRSRGYTLVAIRRRERQGEVLTSGLLSGYAYPIGRLEMVDGQTLVELNNPWTQGAWTGRWGPRSMEFLQRKESLQSRAESCKPFWMSIQDFCNNFTEVLEARAVPGSWQCAAVTLTNERPGYPLVSVSSPTQAIFVLTQSDPRLRTQSESFAPMGLRVYRCRIVAPPQHATGVKQNVSNPFKHLELLAEKPMTKARSVLVELPKLEPSCLYVASVTCSSDEPLRFAVLRVLTATNQRFRELSAPESSYFLKAEETATQALDGDSFSSQGSMENYNALPTPVRNDPMRNLATNSSSGSEPIGLDSRASHYHPGPTDWIGSEVDIGGDIKVKIPSFMQEFLNKCSAVEC